MPVKEYDKLTPDLIPLDKVKIDLTNVHLLQLKSNANIDEIQDIFIPFVAKRIYAYQVLRFLDFFPQHEEKTFSLNNELIKDHTSEINKNAGLTQFEKIDFFKFTASIKDTIKNDHGKVNNCDASVSVDWMLSAVFLQLTHLQDVMLINQEDLPFKEKDACYYGRSVMAVILQEFYSQHKDTMLRNFNVLVPAEDPVLAAAAEEHLKLQRDLALNRDETIEHLKSLKCVKTGKTGEEILKSDFTIFS